MNSPLMRRFNVLGKYTEVWLAFLLFIILALFVVPMPTPLIDLLISLNLMFSVVILMTAMYVRNALEFSVFPALLLVTTLLRIGLSIATTRLILSNTSDIYNANAVGGGSDEFAIEAAKASAGEVIQAFGNFVAGGNAVIGLIIFVIITVVQFVIVAQGSGRVAEVAARFTLDAMPGKQMVIDAEFNQRLITPEEAKEKRHALQAESDFYGSMDGAMKFVKGDAIAGIIIMLVNIIGGFVVGGIMGGMPMGAAGKTFTVLTVGDGLISQIPSLLIAVSAGLIVTRAASPRNMGAELGNQLLQSPRALGISSTIIFTLGAVPGLPTMPLWTLAACVGVAAFLITRQARKAEITDDDLTPSGAPEDEINTNLLRVDPISLEVGPELTRLADPAQDGSLIEMLKQVRRRLALEYGVIVPGVRVKPHPELAPGGYQLRIRGDVLAVGEVQVDRKLAIGRNLSVDGLEGEPTLDPVHRTPALWIHPSQRQIALDADLQVFDPQDLVATHVSEIIKEYLADLLTREEVADLLNMARQESPAVVNELVPQAMTVGQVRMVLQNLVREQVPIKDLQTILNSLADNIYTTKNTFELTEFVRAALGRKICQRYQTGDGILPAFMLHPNAAREIQNSIQMGSGGTMTLNLNPETTKILQENLAALLEENRGQILDPVIVTDPTIRRYVKRLFENQFKKIVVISTAEIVKGVQVRNLGQISTTRQTAGV